jgi:hypothetical protein
MTNKINLNEIEFCDYLCSRTMRIQRIPVGIYRKIVHQHRADNNRRQWLDGKSDLWLQSRRIRTADIPSQR